MNRPGYRIFSGSFAHPMSSSGGLSLPLAFGSPETRQTLGVGGFPALVSLDRAGHIRLIHNDHDSSEMRPGTSRQSWTRRVRKRFDNVTLLSTRVNPVWRSTLSRAKIPLMLNLR